MENILQEFIGKLEKFGKEETQAILEHTQVEKFRKGAFVIKPGKLTDKCYFVLKGCLRQYQIIDEEEKTTGFFLEGQPIVLYSSYLKKMPSQHFLSCIEDSILLSGSREQEKEMHKKYPSLENLIQYLMLHDYDKAENYITLLNGYKPEERYRYILTHQPELLNRVPFHQIASFLGVTPESFSRIRKRISIQNNIKPEH